MSYNPINDPNVQSLSLVRPSLTGMSHVWFDDYFPSNNGNYVYNNQRDTDIEAGRVDVSGSVDKKIFQVFISAIDSASLTIRLEGRLNQEDVWGEIYTEVFIISTPIALLWPICEYLGQVRIGILKTGNGTLDRVSVSGDFVTWKRAFK